LYPTMIGGGDGDDDGNGDADNEGNSDRIT
jgi:hypothetical protein